MRLGVCVLVSLTLGARVAFAEPPRDPVAAEALFQKALEALDAGDWDGACPKFDASMQLDPTVATLLNIAKCHEHQGKLASAWSDYEKALVLNRDTVGEERRKQLDTYARDAKLRLEARLPRLRVVIADPPPGLEVRRDGEPLPAAAVGEAIPTDPGERVISVTAPGFNEVERRVTLEEGKTAELVIELEHAPDAPAVAPVPTHSPPVPPEAPPPPPRSDGGISARTAIGLGLGGLGLLGVGVGAVTGVMTISTASDLEEQCPDPKQCTPAGLDLASEGTTLSTVSTIAFAVGTVSLGVGLYLVLTDDGEPAVSVGAAVGSRGPSLALEGEF